MPHQYAEIFGSGMMMLAGVTAYIGGVSLKHGDFIGILFGLVMAGLTLILAWLGIKII